MTALDHNHLISHNCRDGYRCGAVPALLVSALVAAWIIAFPDRAHSASFESTGQFLVPPRAGLSVQVLSVYSEAPKVAISPPLGSSVVVVNANASDT
jgi:hypothetical protein